MGDSLSALSGQFSVFGFKGNNKSVKGLIGHLYDLKQGPGKKPLAAGVNTNAAAIASEFQREKFDPKVLKPYFVAPTELMGVRFWIPNLSVSEMPVSFGVEKDVTPVALLVHYKGKVSPPKDGTYRFVAFGDDLFGIKFGGKVILPIERRGTYLYPGPEMQAGFYVSSKGGHAVSDPVQLSTSQEYEMEVVLVEVPGGFCTFTLLVECEEDLKANKYKKTENGLPILPLFETNITDPIPKFDRKDPKTPKGMSPQNLIPPHDPNRLLWKVK